MASGLPLESLSRLHLSSSADPSVKSSFRLGTAAQHVDECLCQTSIGLSALAAARFHELRTGIKQDVTVDPRHAVLAFSSEKYYLINGELPQVALFDDLAGMYKTRDGYVRLHTNFPHHKQGLLDILDCSSDRHSVAAALCSWDAIAFEEEAIRRGMCAVALRPFDASPLYTEGQAHRPGTVLPVRIEKIGEAQKRRIEERGRFRNALEGLRVLDMTRVLAGPVCGRTLAEHGADVLLITSPSLPALPVLDIETSRGKRTAQLDLSQDGDAETLRTLLSGADVFLQAYRPGSLTKRGFSPHDVAHLRPGIVCASLSAYPPDSTYAHVRGFDSLVQTLCGTNVAEAQAYKEFMDKSGGGTDGLPPYRALPMQALDHAAGYFLAFGISAALCKTIEVRPRPSLLKLSLTYVVLVSRRYGAQWLRGLGTLDPQIAFGRGKPLPTRSWPPDAEVAALHVDVGCCLHADAERGRAAGGSTAGDQPPQTLTTIRHAALLDETPVRVRCAPMRLDAHAPRWLEGS
ncbi:CoA-transferase family III domain-containing protein [Vararia minispora EC-137]|uniref:CoA-transferase family III domain-containing protein n=1 Tax=Vararia minispora EC-137 TaxID=1314806 RepID=A0ACB8QHX1_9AGAM|nr:CoA-transferase family III domain-containing protein [Vararia minispora EC-137]